MSLLLLLLSVVMTWPRVASDGGGVPSSGKLLTKQNPGSPPPLPFPGPAPYYKGQSSGQRSNRSQDSGNWKREN